MCNEDAIAIARLRGTQLKQFAIPHSCISTIEEDDMNNFSVAFGQVGEEFNVEVNKEHTLLSFIHVLWTELEMVFYF